MRKVILIVSFCLFALSCKAQNIIPIYGGNADILENPYYKDVDNDLDKLVGVWKWENSKSSLTIEFQKKEKVQYTYPTYDNTSTFSKYFDYLIGGYTYKENGITKINTLPIVYNGDPEKNSIAGWNIFDFNSDYFACDQCGSNTRMITLYITEPNHPDLTGKIRIVKFMENGVEKIKLKINLTDISNYTDDYSGPERLIIPEGVYTLVKQ